MAHGSVPISSAMTEASSWVLWAPSQLEGNLHSQTANRDQDLIYESKKKAPAAGEP